MEVFSKIFQCVQKSNFLLLGSCSEWQNQSLTENLKFKICAFHMRNFFCAFLKRKSYTSCDCLWIRGFLQKSFSVCKNVISYFCESAVREWQYQRKFNFNISCFGAEAKFGSKQLFQKINFGNNSWKQWKRMVWSASKHGALVVVSFFILYLYFGFAFVFQFDFEFLSLFDFVPPFLILYLYLS